MLHIDNKLNDLKKKEIHYNQLELNNLKQKEIEYNLLELQILNINNNVNKLTNRINELEAKNMLLSHDSWVQVNEMN
jgi:hypothetical protein